MKLSDKSRDTEIKEANPRDVEIQNYLRPIMQRSRIRIFKRYKITEYREINCPILVSSVTTNKSTNNKLNIKINIIDSKSFTYLKYTAQSPRVHPNLMSLRRNTKLGNTNEN